SLNSLTGPYPSLFQAIAEQKLPSGVPNFRGELYQLLGTDLSWSYWTLAYLELQASADRMASRFSYRDYDHLAKRLDALGAALETLDTTAEAIARVLDDDDAGFDAFVLGIQDGSPAAELVLRDHMADLAAAGVRTIYYPANRGDHQRFVDAFNEPGGDLPGPL